MVSERVRRIALSPTMELSARAARMRAEGVDVLDFSAGQPDFPTPASAKAAGVDAIRQDRTRYTANEGLVELRTAIADKLGRDNGLHYSPEQILVSPGAKASLYFALMALLEPGDEVLIPSPYWVSYPPQVGLAGATPRLVPTDETDGFCVSDQRVRDAITPRSKLLILNYPCNPTGACLTGEQLERIAAVCVDHDLWVIADEIYEKLIYDGLRFTGIASLGEEIRARTVVVNGMSKAYSMTGWRIGYAAGPREVIEAMARLQSHSTSNATSISQWASVEALADSADEVERRRRAFQDRRDALLSGLEATSGIRCQRPQGAFYAFPNVSGCFGRRHPGGVLRSGDDVAGFLLERARVAVVPGAAFGAPDHVRVSYATSLERIREGVVRIGEALDSLSG